MIMMLLRMTMKNKQHLLKINKIKIKNNIIFKIIKTTTQINKVNNNYKVKKYHNEDGDNGLKDRIEEYDE
jgi:hypothetical protein